MFEFNIDDKLYTNIHFIGIGGISMSGLAEILLSSGYRVSGSDSKESKVTRRLEKLGGKIYIGQKAENISDNIDLVIYTDAISSSNDEFSQAQKQGIQMVDRASFLGALMKNYRESLAISGTHGKTTTTSMLSTILNHSEVDPTILLGGQLKDIGGNVKLGSNNYLLTEACEYKGNILKYFPSIAVIMNMDEDHLDYFKSMDHIVDTFSQFAANLKEDGYLIINNDDLYKDRVIASTKARVLSFGIDNYSNYQAKNINYGISFTDFDLYVNGAYQDSFRINLLGQHNVYNALASIAVSHTIGLPISLIKENLNIYAGVERRQEFKGYFRGAKVIDDYAHHPTEIRVTLKAIQNAKPENGKLYCIFQPHTYTRTQKLFESFIASFEDVDVAIITDIYAARELDDGSVHSKDLAQAIRNTNSIYLESFQDIKDFLGENITENDIIVTMGAGNIYELGDQLVALSSPAV